MIDKYYDRGYHTERHKYLLTDDEYFWARAEASARLYFTPAEQELRIFEYGCGIGQGIAKLRNAMGWDVSGEARDACRARNVPVLERIGDVPRNSWDIVFCRHALEHMEHPLDVLNTMRDLIAKGGELYLILPKERHYPSPMEPDLNQHLYCWNFRTINNLLSRAGFKPYLNEECYVLGYRALLPLRRIFGKSVYYWGARFVGRVLRNGELIVRARI